MRREADLDPLGRRQRLQLPARVIHERLRIGGVESNQLVEHDAAELAPRERTEGCERVADVAHKGGTRARRLVDAPVDALENLGSVRVGPRAPGVHDLPNPGNEIGRRRHLVPEIRQLEMGVGIHQARHDGRVAKVDLGPARRLVPAVHRAGTPEGHDPAPIRGDPSIADGRLGDRQHPGGAVSDQ